MKRANLFSWISSQCLSLSVLINRQLMGVNREHLLANTALWACVSVCVSARVRSTLTIRWFQSSDMHTTGGLSVSVTHLYTSPVHKHRWVYHHLCTHGLSLTLLYLTYIIIALVNSGWMAVSMVAHRCKTQHMQDYGNRRISTAWPWLDKTKVNQDQRQYT